MRKKKKEKLKHLQFWSTFSYINLKDHTAEIPSHMRRVNFRIWDHVEDEYILMMMEKVRSIDMLDLDETHITIDSIKALTNLQFIKELRLKGINNIDDASIPYINNIKGLELLHVGGTAINLQGLKKLDNLPGLKTLLFSYDDTQEELDEGMKILRGLMPVCEFLVNHKSYDFKDEPDYS